MQVVTIQKKDEKDGGFGSSGGGKKKNQVETSRPTNFHVKIDNKVYENEAYVMYDESNLNKTNYEVLALLGMDEDELKRESKLGLKKQNIGKKKGPNDFIPVD
jgi:hypothetical protein